MLYTDEYYKSVARKTHIRLYAMLALLAVVAAAIVLCCIYRLKVLNYIAAGVGFVAVYFIWNLKLTPWLRYNKFMREMKNGQKRSLEVEFVSVTPETRFYDGVEVHDFTTRIEVDGVNDEDERLYVFDADMKLPELAEGQKIKVTSFGSFVVDITPC